MVFLYFYNQKAPHMNVFKKSVLFIAFASLVMPAGVFGQYQFPMHPFLSYFGDLQRYEIAFNVNMPSGSFEGVQRVTTDGTYGGYYLGDTTIKRDLSSMGFGGSIGLSLPFKATGHISCWAMAIQLGVNMHTWTNLNSTYKFDGTLVSPTDNALTASTMQVHLPIGIDWKVGNDAIKSQRLALGASMGLGVIPQLNMTSASTGQNIRSNYGFGCTPYAKVEGNFRLGWVFKLRAMYSMGDISLLRVNKRIDGYTDGPFSIISTSNLTFSLVIMPFSGSWRETDWWNTWDTYNEHDRFN